MIAEVYINDFLAISDIETVIQNFKKEMESVWTIADLRIPKHILGIAVN